MGDDDILEQIQRLVDEEHTIRTTGGEDGDDRLTRLEETLDQCWDLLRQRRARREFGESEGDATVRDTDTVEHYRQ